MTHLQKEIVIQLLEGGYIIGHQKYAYRLRTTDHQVVRKFHRNTFRSVKHLLRKRNNLFLIDKNKVRQQHGSTFVKKQYEYLKTMREEMVD